MHYEHIPATILIVAAMSHSCLQIPGVVGGGGAGVVVVVVVIRRVVFSILASGAGLEIEMSLFRNFSIENGVVEDDGHPVNSVEALKNDV